MMGIKNLAVSSFSMHLTSLEPSCILKALRWRRTSTQGDLGGTAEEDVKHAVNTK